MYLYVSRVTIYVVTSEWFLCVSCEAGGERAKVPEYVGQKKRSVWDVSSEQSPAVLGELLVPRGQSSLCYNTFLVPERPPHQQLRVSAPGNECWLGI